MQGKPNSKPTDPTTRTPEQQLQLITAIIKESETQAPSYDPGTLSYFNPVALEQFKMEVPQVIYADDSTGEADMTNHKHFRMIQLQAYDHLMAMKYAEQQIMPKLVPERFAELTPELIVGWLKELHRIGAKTLFACEGRQSGNFTTGHVLRWHQGIGYANSLQLLWVTTPEGSRAQNKALHEKLTAAGLDKDEAGSYIELVEQYEQDTTIDVNEFYPDAEPVDTDYETLSKLGSAMYKISIAYNLDKLTSLQKRAVDKLFKICVLPSQIEPAMYQFATDLIIRLKNYQEVMPTDEQMADLLTWIYFTVTDIHPFDNGNGRTTFLFDSCFLYPFKFPSIMLRTIEQLHDDNSTYNIAVKQINSDLSYLRKHFMANIALARRGLPKSEHLIYVLHVRRIELALRAQYVASRCAELNIDSEQSELYLDLMFKTAFNEYLQFAEQILTPNVVSGSQVSHALTAQLKLMPPPKETPHKTFSNSDCIDLIKQLTGLQSAGWKFNSKNGGAFWAVVDRQVAFDKCEELKQHSQAFTVRVCKNGNATDTSLLVFQNIRFEELAQLRVAQGNDHK